MLLAGLCPMGLSASSRFRKSHCHRWRPWTWPGVWCRRGGPLLRMRSWRPAGRLVPDEEDDLWQGLAQICVGLTHAARGNSVGAVRLLERGAARLQEYDAGDGSTYGLDLSAVVTCAREHAAIDR
jgi:hypothetical protein